MAEVGKFYLNNLRAKYKVAYITPVSNALPAQERWVFLTLASRSLQDPFAQKYVSIPLITFDSIFRPAETSNPKLDDSATR